MVGAFVVGSVGVREWREERRRGMLEREENMVYHCYEILDTDTKLVTHLNILRYQGGFVCRAQEYCW